MEKVSFSGSKTKLQFCAVNKQLLDEVLRLLKILSYSVIIRDKVGNFGQFDDKTLFGNESNFHTFYNTVGQNFQNSFKSS